MLPLLAAAALASASPSTDGGIELPPTLARFLASGRWDSTPAAFRIITLSNIAEGCAFQASSHPERRDAAAACIDRTLELGRERLGDVPMSEVEDGLWLAHYNLMLGARDAVGPCPDFAVHQALSLRLRAMSLEDPHAHMASYANHEDRWPADQSIALLSLKRFDTAHGTTLLVTPLAAWKTELDLRTHAATGLPASEVALKHRTSKLPRGCAQSMLARSVAELDPPLACTWWKSYRRNWWVKRGPFVGFREWPPGVDGAFDSDSGPIVLGIGTAASALGIAGARAMGDENTALALERSANLASRFIVLDTVASTVLAQSIRFEARWQAPMATCP